MLLKDKYLYHQWIEEKLGLKSSKNPFFYTTGDKKLTESSLAYAFKLIRPCINSNPTGYPYVRLYDFRHTFACNTILRWNEQGEDVNETKRLPSKVSKVRIVDEILNNKKESTKVKVVRK